MIPIAAPKIHNKFGITLASLLFLLNITDDMAATAYAAITAMKRTEVSKNNLKSPNKSKYIYTIQYITLSLNTSSVNLYT
jgi:hypothetical protein